MKSVYAETCTIKCTDNDRVLETELLNFKPEVFLDVSVVRSFKLKMLYDHKHNIYVGSMSGYEFTTDGPEQLS